MLRHKTATATIATTVKTTIIITGIVMTTAIVAETTIVTTMITVTTGATGAATKAFALPIKKAITTALDKEDATLAEIAVDITATTAMAMVITTVGAETTTGVFAKRINADFHAAIAKDLTAIDAVRGVTNFVTNKK